MFFQVLPDFFFFSTYQLNPTELVADEYGKVKNNCNIGLVRVPGRPLAHTAYLSGPSSPSPLSALSHR